jgi:valyl-tRNA synthetase
MLPNGPYDAQKTEPKILKFWLDNKFFKPEYDPQKGLLTTEEMKNDKRDTFSIINPPPNAYMRPHIGNVSGYAYQDVFLRYNRLKGKKVLGQPGKDHAGIQGEVILEKIFWENKKKTKYDMGREKFYRSAYEHFVKIMPKIMEDEQRIGLSSDYDRNLFTLDPRIVKTILDTFIKMYQDNMVYKGVRIVNWDPVAQTTLADIDTERVTRETDLVYIHYPLADEKGNITVATTRAETMLGDTAVVVHPDDERYKHLIGTKVKLPLTDREIPIISSPRVTKEFGTGAVKLTPAHSYDDYVMMTEWNASNPDNQIGYINVIDKNAKMTGPIADKYVGLSTEDCRKTVIQDLTEQKLILKSEKHEQNVIIGERSKAVVEPIMSSQWFIDVEKLKKPAIEAVKNGEVKIHPAYMSKKYLHWMENLHDWPVSRSLWWGYRIPVWYKGDLEETINEDGFVQEKIAGTPVTDIFDAVEKGLAKVQLHSPDLEINFSPILLPGRYAPEIKTLYKDLKQIFPFAQVVDTGEISQNYEDYKVVLDQVYFDQNSVVVAHSLGAPAIIQYLQQNNISIKAIIFLAPSNEASPKFEHDILSGFWKEISKLDQLKNNVQDIFVIYSDDDELFSKESFEVFADKIGAQKLFEPNKKHFLTTKYRHDSDNLNLLLQKYHDEYYQSQTLAQELLLIPGKHGYMSRQIFPEITNRYNNSSTLEVADISTPSFLNYANSLKAFFDKNKYFCGTVIAHSLGARAILRYVVENKISLQKVILIAPACGNLRDKDIDAPYADLWEDNNSLTEAKKYIADLTIIYSDDDELMSVKDFEEFTSKVNADKIFVESGKKHYAGKDYDIISDQLEDILGKPDSTPKWQQDENVFDTWFSSGQWVYATLLAHDLADTFMPTSVMETAYDILELWVSRMMMLTIYTQGKIPFQDVYLHGLVKAPDGQKMSKSKNNVIQPEEIINKFGADALRLLYVVGNKAGAGYPVSYEKLEGNKRFLNKIWNAAKFVLSNLEDIGAKICDIHSNDLAFSEEDIIIREHMRDLIEGSTKKMDKFHIGIVAQELYDSFWHTFADVYIEQVKIRLYTRDQQGNPINTDDKAKQSRLAAQWTIYFTLKNYLKLLHPFVPFITEAIWQELPKVDGESKTIMHSTWPK